MRGLLTRALVTTFRNAAFDVGRSGFVTYNDFLAAAFRPFRGCTRALRACPWPYIRPFPITFWELALRLIFAAHVACFADGFLRA